MWPSSARLLATIDRSSARSGSSRANEPSPVTIASRALSALSSARTASRRRAALAVAAMTSGHDACRTSSWLPKCRHSRCHLENVFVPTPSRDAFQCLRPRRYVRSSPGPTASNESGTGSRPYMRALVPIVDWPRGEPRPSALEPVHGVLEPFGLGQRLESVKLVPLQQLGAQGKKGRGLDHRAVPGAELVQRSQLRLPNKQRAQLSLGVAQDREFGSVRLVADGLAHEAQHGRDLRDRAQCRRCGYADLDARISQRIDRDGELLGCEPVQCLGERL